MILFYCIENNVILFMVIYSALCKLSFLFIYFSWTRLLVDQEALELLVNGDQEKVSKQLFQLINVAYMIYHFYLYLKINQIWKKNK